ncbi:hypothetical protein F5050DRAFT_771912 [Lentinula boryana]|uniref:Uncharacterized protein n=1 Tax=Lentinula boryana TaxID=40481 RepID=A0ABQ8QN11_9AGAR|nr:hypothetical protein F5050DRAFT_771912 [Lentinula boryana]
MGLWRLCRPGRKCRVCENRMGAYQSPYRITIHRIDSNSESGLVRLSSITTMVFAFRIKPLRRLHLLFFFFSCGYPSGYSPTLFHHKQITKTMVITRFIHVEILLMRDFIVSLEHGTTTEVYGYWSGSDGKVLTNVPQRAMEGEKVVVMYFIRLLCQHAEVVARG